MSLAVEFREITKAFGPVQVLHGVSFELAPGRVVGLLGENGAGKSTLMKILAGYEQPSGGSLLVDGQPRRFASSREAQAQGIVLIHQEFNLAEDLTIAQNIFLGHEKKCGWRLDEAAMERETARVLAEVGLRASPGTRVRQLIVAEKQLVEIAKALARNARLLVMDEPTATLTPGETERLFALVARLKAGGTTIVYISHKLDEVERITDEVVVMRDGRFVARQPTAALTRHQMANLMVGRELSDLFPPRQPPLPDAPVLLRVRDLSVPGWAQGASFEVRAGEIFGFAGLVGAGRTELFEGLLGLRPCRAAGVEIAGHASLPKSPREAADQGLTYLSEDRKGKGLHVQLPLAENLTLMNLRAYGGRWLQPAAEQAALRQAVAAFGIRTGDLGCRASQLSGGNQQKLALAKVLQPQPRVVVLDEPTRGVDVGAKRDIYFLIQRLAAQGRAVVVISSELPELIGLCHRVAVMRAGRIAATLAQEQLNEEELIGHATGTR
ncbi:sugar ABC transporter ATP-binding protein [Ramlibacter tataouinensis]|uniref:Candidate Ribose/xylose/arabinose/galactoside ABC type transport system, ATP-binding component with duplicated domains n=1 Tax=Ramlibacter tataouinensis (strain ATCC BAA-407 / DSM 14655 / LMG 21543 / TTB310) TaxID=365046 RepID=F5XXK6_RAMTT|nr:sugar ABC transporter ATP-binding protein [Ramlibacter tataouinensis]AEG91809.1 candidate Ribose/xylose/arabinose/galactoside ABC type transport system, ATP-binding component with duplicated domains [Ramlibacter tataouinensis TTB310]